MKTIFDNSRITAEVDSNANTFVIGFRNTNDRGMYFTVAFTRAELLQLSNALAMAGQMVPEQKDFFAGYCEWCCKKIDSIEGYKTLYSQGENIKLHAKTCLSAWLDARTE